MLNFNPVLLKIRKRRPLRIESVENEIQNADKSRNDARMFLVHHSRDTKEKQWAETKRLTLNGLAKLFKGNLKL